MSLQLVTVRAVELPIAKPLVTSNIRIQSIWFLVTDVCTSDGAVGRAYIWAFNEACAKALVHTIEHLSSSVFDEDPFFSSRLWSRMWKASIQLGHGGTSVMAMGAIDSAVWDLVGRIARQPLANLLGRRLERLPVYASGLWITDDMQELAREAQALLDQGFRAMKMRVGRDDLQRDRLAVSTVRSVVGSEVDLMVDFSSAIAKPYATRLAHALEEFDLCWIEDPIADENVADHAHMASELRTPICFGEKVYAPQGLQAIVNAQAADILMVDLQRAGGVTGWQRCAAIADAARLPITTHLLPELNVHLAASAPTGGYLEYIDWAQDLFENKLELSDGTVTVPEGPGIGLRWDEERLARHTVQTWEFTKCASRAY